MYNYIEQKKRIYKEMIKNIYTKQKRQIWGGGGEKKFQLLCYNVARTVKDSIKLLIWNIYVKTIRLNHPFKTPGARTLHKYKS